MSVQSVERAFHVLRALAVAPCGVSDLARTVSLPKSTVARLLGTLESLGAVERTEGAEYRIGDGMGAYAGPGEGSALTRLVGPHLDRLATALGEATGLTLPEGFRALYVAQVESPSPVQVRDFTGTSVPVHVGAGGIVIMAEWPAEVVESYLARPLQAFTSRTLTDPEQIRARLAVVRASGHCWVREEFAEGINSVAAPVRDRQGRVVAAISAHGPSYRFPAAGDEERVARMVAQTADTFSRQLHTM